MIELATDVERWELIEPFVTARDANTHVPVLVVRLTNAAGQRGWAEAAGVDYDGETPASMAAQVEAVRSALHDRLTGAELIDLLPAGGARNALDCALWDLRAKESGRPAWKLAALPAPHPVTTAFTIGLGDAQEVRRKARQALDYPLLKLKVDAERHVGLVRVVREEHPTAHIIVDANQSWTRELLERLTPELQQLGVELIEQPVARGDDASLDGLRSPLAVAADESCTDRHSLAGLAGRYQCVNIKLDKCGGLTEALAMCAEARRLGLGLMVGNMCGTSLAMAPAFLVAQACLVTDLDGPLLQRLDRPHPIRFERGVMQAPDSALWG
ncbi:MAG: N-acetyl-D-Glu racemase DgcA [Steroidobacteraceae bacterium]|nr:dipeptide epimerase [Steroidobacteraceae bacterium]MBP7013962.1 dipeptide epimerase [Steroidobacteraceae bacterium]